MIRTFLILAGAYVVGLVSYIIYINRNTLREQWNDFIHFFSSPQFKKNILRGIIGIIVRLIRKRIFKI